MLLDCLTEAAKALLVKTGTIDPAFFLCNDEKLMGEPFLMSMFDRICGYIPDMDEAKTRNVFLIGGMAQKLKANRVIIIWDAAFRTVAASDAKSAFNDQTERPLLYPKSMRTECIIVNEVLLPSGDDQTIVIPYKGGEGEPVEFLSDDPVTKALAEGGAKFESRFTQLILDGYNRAGGL